MEKAEYIRARLHEDRLTQSWLIQKLGRRGVNTCKSEMSMTLSGGRTGPKADKILDLGVQIIAEYEQSGV